MRKILNILGGKVKIRNNEYLNGESSGLEAV